MALSLSKMDPLPILLLSLLLLLVSESDSDPNPKTNFQFPFKKSASNSNLTLSKNRVTSLKKNHHRAQIQYDDNTPEPDNTPAEPEPEPEPEPMECYICDGFEKCETLWKKIASTSGDPNAKLESEDCSEFDKDCRLMFVTRVFDGERYLKGIDPLYPGTMFLLRTECTYPVPHGSNNDCFSTPVQTVFGKDDNQKRIFDGKHGISKCYCSSGKCTNSLECYQFSCKVGSNDPKELCDAVPELKPEIKHYAVECYIESETKDVELGTEKVKDSRLFSGISDVTNLDDIYYNEGPETKRTDNTPPCEEEFNVEDWEGEDTLLITRRCVCPGNGCNKMISEIATYFSKPVLICNQCQGQVCRDSVDLDSKPCRRREVCYMKYVKASNGNVELEALGCGVPPTPTSDDPEEERQLLRNRCAPISDDKRSRTCYCDSSDLCNSKLFECRQCTDNDCQSQSQKSARQSETCKGEECYISYGGPDKMEAGCRGLTFEPDCDPKNPTLAGQGCRCDAGICNSIVDELMPPPTPKPGPLERICFSEKPCTDEECKSEENLKTMTTCVDGIGPNPCRYTRKMSKPGEIGEKRFTKSRGCASDYWTSIELAGDNECIKVVHGARIDGQCLCSNDKCNGPSMDVKLDEVEDPQLKHQSVKIKKNGAARLMWEDFFWRLLGILIGACLT